MFRTRPPGYLQSWFLVLYYCHVDEKSKSYFVTTTYRVWVFWEELYTEIVDKSSPQAFARPCPGQGHRVRRRAWTHLYKLRRKHRRAVVAVAAVVTSAPSLSPLRAAAVTTTATAITATTTTAKATVTTTVISTATTARLCLRLRSWRCPDLLSDPFLEHLFVGGFFGIAFLCIFVVLAFLGTLPRSLAFGMAAAWSVPAAARPGRGFPRNINQHFFCVRSIFDTRICGMLPYVACIKSPYLTIGNSC